MVRCPAASIPNGFSGLVVRSQPKTREGGAKERADTEPDILV